MGVRPTVFAAVSGGVDSSVALALLKRQGYAPVGCFMKNWSQALPGLSCNWTGDRADAVRVCAKLGVPFRTADLEDQYRQKVFSRFIREYQKGRTPNPDVACNSEIKFKAFLTWAKQHGADLIATGHYARLERKLPTTKSSFPNLKIANCKLKISADPEKDQTYFLYRLGQRELKQTLFPIGEYRKSEVRQLAQRLKLPTAAKPDSQGICFVGKVALREFLKNWIYEKHGDIVLLPPPGAPAGSRREQRRGRVIGRHPGAWYYTIGQRHGLGLRGGSKQALYVARKDVKNNVLYVAPRDHPALYKKALPLTQVHWVGTAPPLPLRCSSRIRYRQPLQRCTLSIPRRASGKNISSSLRTPRSPNDLEITFDKPQWAPAAGQSAVFYARGEILGGSLIA